MASDLEESSILKQIVEESLFSFYRVLKGCSDCLIAFKYFHWWLVKLLKGLKWGYMWIFEPILMDFAWVSFSAKRLSCLKVKTGPRVLWYGGGDPCINVITPECWNCTKGIVLRWRVPMHKSLSAESMMLKLNQGYQFTPRVTYV